MNAVRLNLPRLAVLPVLLALSTVFVGCSSVNQLLGKEESIDYKSAAKPTVAKLEVPPDLTQLPTDNRFQVPGQATAPAPSTTTFSSYSSAKPEQTVATNTNVLPQRSDMRVERNGDQRWLVVENRSPETIYPVVRQFWQDLGFMLREDLPQAGVMETDWAENRAKIPQDFIRNTVGKVFDSLWSTGERDMFRTRLERVGNNTEIYISHRGAVEVLTGAEKSQTTWTARPNDPGLEAEFLTRLMVRLGSDSDRAKVAVQQAATAGSAAPQLISGSGEAGALQIAESFDRAWRRVGLALDRGGFTVEDRNRAEGTYYVRYVDSDAVSGESKPGFFGKLFGRDEKPENRPQYRVKLNGVGDRTQVTVLNLDGVQDNTPTGRRILNVLANQLK